MVDVLYKRTLRLLLEDGWERAGQRESARTLSRPKELQVPGQRRLRFECSGLRRGRCRGWREAGCVGVGGTGSTERRGPRAVRAGSLAS